MAIEIPDAVTFAALAGYDKRRGYSQLERIRDALEAALPHLIPAITADLRAQIEAEHQHIIGHLKSVAQDGDIYLYRRHENQGYPDCSSNQDILLCSFGDFLGDLLEATALAGTEGGDDEPLYGEELARELGADEIDYLGGE